MDTRTRDAVRHRLVPGNDSALVLWARENSWVHSRTPRTGRRELRVAASFGCSSPRTSGPSASPSASAGAARCDGSARLRRVPPSRGSTGLASSPGSRQRRGGPGTEGTQPAATSQRRPHGSSARERNTAPGFRRDAPGPCLCGCAAVTHRRLSLSAGGALEQACGPSLRLRESAVVGAEGGVVVLVAVPVHVVVVRGGLDLVLGHRDEQTLVVVVDS